MKFLVLFLCFVAVTFAQIGEVQDFVEGKAECADSDWSLDTPPDEQPAECRTCPCICEGSVAEFTSENFWPTVDRYNVVVLFTSSSCSDCDAFEPDFIKAAESISKSNPNTVFGLLYVESPEQRDVFDVQVVPTIKFFARSSQEPLSIFDDDYTVPKVVGWVTSEIQLASSQQSSPLGPLLGGKRDNMACRKCRIAFPCKCPGKALELTPYSFNWVLNTLGSMSAGNTFGGATFGQGSATPMLAKAETAIRRSTGQAARKAAGKQRAAGAGRAPVAKGASRKQGIVASAAAKAPVAKGASRKQGIVVSAAAKAPVAKGTPPPLAIVPGAGGSKSEGGVFVYFYDPADRLSRSFMPLYDTVAKNLAGNKNIIVAKLAVPTPTLKDYYEVMKTPNIKFFLKGYREPVASYNGKYTGSAEVETWMRQRIEKDVQGTA